MRTSDQSELTLRVRHALRSVHDPDIGVNIVDLGLVYHIDADAKGVAVHLTMTSPSSSLGALLAGQVRSVILAELGGDSAVDVRLVWEPPWQPEMMTPAARRQLGWTHLAGV